MLSNSQAFSGFPVNDIDAAQKFYQDTLGLSVKKTAMGLVLHLTGSNNAFIYAKPDHHAADFTLLNFPVDDIDAALTELEDRGITFEHYNDPNIPQDDKGVLRGRAVNMGPDIAWFKDPSGNILSILQND